MSDQKLKFFGTVSDQTNKILSKFKNEIYCSDVVYVVFLCSACTNAIWDNAAAFDGGEMQEVQFVQLVDEVLWNM